MSSGMGHLQKGHGIGFGDLDNDGDQDVYVTLGGAVEGDDAHNALFVNPNTGNNWLRLQLRSSENKNSIGARVRVTGKTASGNLQNWYHTVGDGGTFGSNSMELEIGMGALTEILEVGIDWPGRKREVYKEFDINKAWICKEGVSMPQIRKLSRSVLKGNSGSKACCK